MYLQRLFFIAIIVLLVGGCSDNVMLNGTVTFPDGTPVTKGMINFDSGQTTFMGAIDRQGRYAPAAQNGNGPGIPPGKYRIWLTGTAEVPNIAGADNTVHQGAPIEKVARKFCNPETSGLTCEVNPGGFRRFDIVVDKP